MKSNLRMTTLDLAPSAVTATSSNNSTTEPLISKEIAIAIGVGSFAVISLVMAVIVIIVVIVVLKNRKNRHKRYYKGYKRHSDSPSSASYYDAKEVLPGYLR
ncbi:hypothetical protein C9374_010503 [Naegleria lovaniensis]|uniref:Uncharacterized protein n=1 Tax=Naegleria lovaniensis TaxID=51637 RepID=A0AA88GHP5_NAELO|nr:uncharacterized protein C9374_010503 [Naegleria lovaniensis]KAG2374759.1 hypothetical protein C9374_010503 [Naegleria lovaniensis]